MVYEHAACRSDAIYPLRHEPSQREARPRRSNAQPKLIVVCSRRGPNDAIRIMGENGNVLGRTKLESGTKHPPDFVVSAVRSKTVTAVFSTCRTPAA